MRNAFAEAITDLAAQDKRIVLLSGDIGNRLFDRFKSLHAGRFLNCGVAEANMIGMAAGMALCGLRPVTYTIASFSTVRCLEQIRVDLCYHNVPVIVVGVGAGLAYAANGPTHHSCEDLAMLRVLPNMTVVCPGDAWEVRAALAAAVQHAGPVYIRIGKKGERLVHSQAPKIVLGKALVIKPGSRICLLSTGNMLPEAVDLGVKLDGMGLSTQVVSVHTVKPLDQELLSEVFARFPLVVTIEEHSRLGGLGGSVAEWLADQAPQTASLLRIGTQDEFIHEAGEQEHARALCGLTVEQMHGSILSMLAEKASRKKHAGLEN